MSSPADPHRTLGLRPGASTAEIKAAYRRLAKEFHPDSAGQAALPRFLAIQAAYESLVGDGTGGSRPGAAPGSRRGQPWQGDTDRARSARPGRGGYWTGRRGATGGTADRAPGGPTGPGDGTERTDPYAWSRSRRRPGDGHGAGTPPDGPASGGRRRRGTAGDADMGRTGRRGPRRATLGSTSYDDAQEFEPDWAGGDWYGPTSGTYWTINPKEYADPRKHGPDYQARGRRRGSTSGPWDEPTVGGAAATSGPAEATWSAGPSTEAVPDAGREPPARPSRMATPVPAATGETAGPGAIERVAFALAGWPPIGWLLAAGLGEVSGCNDFAASCPPAAEPATILVQPLVVGLLLLLPNLAFVATGGSVGALAVAIPGAMLFAALGAARDPSGRAALVLTGLIAIGYVVGLVAAARGWPYPPRWRTREASATD